MPTITDERSERLLNKRTPKPKPPSKKDYKACGCLAGMLFDIVVVAALYYYIFLR